VTGDGSGFGGGGSGFLGEGTGLGGAGSGSLGADSGSSGEGSGSVGEVSGLVSPGSGSAGFLGSVRSGRSGSSTARSQDSLLGWDNWYVMLHSYLNTTVKHIRKSLNLLGSKFFYLFRFHQAGNLDCAHLFSVAVLFTHVHASPLISQATYFEAVSHALASNRRHRRASGMRCSFSLVIYGFSLRSWLNMRARIQGIPYGSHQAQPVSSQLEYETLIQGYLPLIRLPK